MPRLDNQDAARVRAEAARIFTSLTKEEIEAARAVKLTKAQRRELVAAFQTDAIAPGTVHAIFGASGARLAANLVALHLVRRAPANFGWHVWLTIDGRRTAAMLILKDEP